MRFVSVGLVSLVSLALAVGCGSSDSDDPVVGGPCNPVLVPGTYTVTSIVDSPPGDETCGTSPQEVVVSFTPDPGAPSDAAYPGPGRLVIDLDGADLDAPAACLTSLGITVGSTFTGTRRINTAGSCALFADTLDVDFSSCTCPGPLSQ